MPHLLLDGTPGSYALAPYRPEYNEPSIVDVRVELDLDGYAGTVALINRWSGVSTASVWQFILSDKTGIVQVRDSAVAQHTSVAGAVFTLTSGTRSQLRAVADTASNLASFYQRATGTALTSDAGWSQVGSSIALAANDLLQPTETPIQVGAVNTGGLVSPAAGKFYRAVVKKGAGGTLIFDPDFEDTSTWTFA